MITTPNLDDSSLMAKQISSKIETKLRVSYLGISLCLLGLHIQIKKNKNFLNRYKDEDKPKCCSGILELNFMWWGSVFSLVELLALYIQGIKYSNHTNPTSMDGKFCQQYLSFWNKYFSHVIYSSRFGNFKMMLGLSLTGMKLLYNKF